MQNENNAETTCEEGGITIGGIFRTIAVKKWLALIIAAVITLVGTIVIYFGYNRMSQKYNIEFSLILPGMNINPTIYTYPDGKIFQYSTFVSAESLTAVKQSDKKYADLNVEDIIKKGGISVERISYSEKKSETVETEKSEVCYSISVKTNVFPDEDIAKDFLRDVASAPCKYVSEMYLDYDNYLTLSTNAEDYEEQLSLLSSQLNHVISQYNSLIASHGEKMVANGRTLSAQLNEITSYSSRNVLGRLKTKVRSEAILKSEEYLEKLPFKRIDLQRQLDIAKVTLDTLLKGPESSGSADGNTFLDAQVLKSQSDLVESLKQQIADIDYYIDNGKVNESFETTEIAPEYETIKQFTQGLKKTVVEIYDKTSSVVYTNPVGVKTEGGFGLIMSGGLSLVVGVIIALIVAYIFGRRKLNEKSTEAVKSEPTVSGEALMQTAVADAETDKENK